jgi:hypothetical protein
VRLALETDHIAVWPGALSGGADGGSGNDGSGNDGGAHRRGTHRRGADGTPARRQEEEQT